MSILVTGGAGFIGSHTVVELLNAGYDVIIVDNFVNSKPEALEAIKKITGKDFKFYKVDIVNKEELNKVFDENPDIQAVIHFAALKAVGESVAKPIEYYENNLNGTLSLVDCMRKHNVKKIVFSSSATVYGDPASVPIKEDYKRCMRKQPAKSKVFTIESLQKIQDEMRNCCIKSYNKVYCENSLLKQKKKGRNRDIDIKDMGDYREIKRQLEKKEEQLKEANKQTKKIDNTSKDIDKILDSLKPTLINKNNMVISNEDVQKIKNYAKDVKE